MTQPKHGSSKKKFIEVLKGNQPSRPPFWLMRQAGRYLPEYREVRSRAGGFMDLCFTPKLATEVTLQPLRRYGMDAAILFSDILVVPHALGVKVSFEEGKGPILEKISKESGCPSFDPQKFHQTLEPVYETLGRIRENLDEETALIGFSGAPWTVATYMLEGGSSRDFKTSREWACSRTDEMEHLINILTQSTSEYLIRQVEAGAEVLQIFDSWSGVLTQTLFQKWVIGPIKKIVQNVHEKHPDIPIIAFPRGCGPMLMEFVKETGVQAVSLDESIPTKWAAENVQKLCPVQGNLDPYVLAQGGSLLREEVMRILDDLGDGLYIFNLGHGVIPSTPPENVMELVNILKA